MDKILRNVLDPEIIGFGVYRYGSGAVGGAIMGSLFQWAGPLVEYAAAAVGGEIAVFLSSGGMEVFVLMMGRPGLAIESVNALSGIGGNYARHRIM